MKGFFILYFLETRYNMDLGQLQIHELVLNLAVYRGLSRFCYIGIFIGLRRWLRRLLRGYLTSKPLLLLPATEVFSKSCCSPTRIKIELVQYIIFQINKISMKTQIIRLKTRLPMIFNQVSSTWFPILVTFPAQWAFVRHFP